MKHLISFLILAVFCSISFANDTVSNNRLFIIERSKNANVVCYDANITKDGQIDKVNPIDAYWIMYAENAGRQEIGTFEKRAYGFKINYNESTKDFDFSLKAVENKNMNIIMVDENPKVKIMINNTESYLNKVYIQSKDVAFGIPKVYYYVLYGTTVATNENIEEKIVLKK